MSLDILEKVVVYIVPALIMAYMGIRGRRLNHQEHTVTHELQRRLSDSEMGRNLRDELYQRWKECDEQNDLLRAEVSKLKARVGQLRDVLAEHGIPIPPEVL